jgi:hypothetical protein
MEQMIPEMQPQVGQMMHTKPRGTQVAYNYLRWVQQLLSALRPELSLPAINSCARGTHRTGRVTYVLQYHQITHQITHEPNTPAGSVCYQKAAGAISHPHPSQKSKLPTTGEIRTGLQQGI